MYKDVVINRIWYEVPSKMKEVGWKLYNLHYRLREWLPIEQLALEGDEEPLGEGAVFFVMFISGG